MLVEDIFRGLPNKLTPITTSLEVPKTKYATTPVNDVYRPYAGGSWAIAA